MHRGLFPPVLVLGVVRVSEMPPHLVTVNRWFFTTIVASGFVGSEPGRMSNTSKSKGWKNWPGNENISGQPLPVAMVMWAFQD